MNKHHSEKNNYKKSNKLFKSENSENFKKKYITSNDESEIQVQKRNRNRYGKDKKYRDKFKRVAYKWLHFFKVLGPGFIVMVADMDAGSVTTAAVSGAQWGYKLVLMQIILIPFLYLIQSMTSRLGCVTRKGHGELIREYYGSKWAAFSTALLFLTVFAALLTEFSGIAASGEIFNIPKIYSIGFSVLILLIVVFRGSYKKAENIALIFALSGFVFIPAAIFAHPDLHKLVFSGLIGSQPIFNKNYAFLIAANAGAVIMPWMIYYQQSATVDKNLCKNDVKLAAADTLVGSIATQLLMIAVIVMTAATLYTHHIIPSSAKAIGQSLIPLAGKYAGLLFAVGLYSSSVLAAFVVSMAFAWAAGETWGFKHSLNNKFKESKMFHFLYMALIIMAALIVLAPNIPLVTLMVDVEAFNGFVLPIVLVFLILLAGNKKILGEHAYSKAKLAIVALVGLIMVVLGIITVLPQNWL
ncbi:MAG: divalent metal cation transporter [Candidatus Acididesulfobacter guangdongensis]|uniref:Divalent metal cation transporter n=1 Tax=Acididesulfobacter guangdongensis TaxID=2597225 RepID=A0A519BHR3_ACIG2|nr:MAG: divalent metal cation transporter [Candidatus Acididesulfobacter guangdongensis]